MQHNYHNCSQLVFLYFTYLQDVTRVHKGWALDSVVLQNLITRYNKEDVKESPNEGVYIHGLFLEGAGLDRRSGKLIESKPKVLYEQMPVIYIYAINTTAGKDPKLYECPIYRKPQRTMRSTLYQLISKLITTLDIGL